VARKNSLQRNQALRVVIITVHGQDFKMFIDDQQGQIIIITGVVECSTGQHLRSKCQLAFYSRSFRVRDSRCGGERERVENSRSRTRCHIR
jgi:hypothetical protein